MKKYFVIYNVDTGRKVCGHGVVDIDQAPDGTTVAEWIARKLLNSANRVAYFDADTVFDSTTQKIENDTIVDIPQDDLDIASKMKIARANLRARDVEVFEMLLAVWQVGVDKELWAGADLSVRIRQIAVEWKQQLEKLGL
jgi:hypothetical protein